MFRASTDVKSSVLSAKRILGSKYDVGIVQTSVKEERLEDLELPPSKLPSTIQLLLPTFDATCQHDSSSATITRPWVISLCNITSCFDHGCIQYILGFLIDANAQRERLPPTISTHHGASDQMHIPYSTQFFPLRVTTALIDGRTVGDCR